MVDYVFQYGTRNAFGTVIATRACALFYTLLVEVIMHSAGQWPVDALVAGNPAPLVFT